MLVELFTSEGCSSCPAADRLLARLAAEQPVSGALVVPIAFHVDYWNRLGWDDPFSSAAFTRRQSAYAALLGNDGDIYTPQMIVGGRTEFVGSDERDARRAIEAAAKQARAFVRVFPADASTARVSVTGVAAGADVTLAVIEDGLVSDVTRGENAGKRLTHTAVARDLVEAGAVDAAGRFHASVPFRSGPGVRRIFAFVQDRATGRILGVSVPAQLPRPR